jgi:transposase-like protein
MFKYSDEQRQVAVQHYRDHDRCVASTMKALGYPCRETLTVWIDELHPELRQRIVGRAPNDQHSLELKNAAVIDLCTRKTSAQEIAQKLAVWRQTLYKWKNQLLGREAPASMKPPKDSDSAPDKSQLTDLQQQVDLLQRNIRRLQLEHDLLKKANELLKKDLGVAPQLLSNREKTLLADALKHTYTLVDLFGELDLARSSYFYHCAQLRRSDKYADARFAITDVDITKFHIPAGNVYISPMIDCFEGLVVSWTLGTRPDAELVNTMLDTAIEAVAEFENRPVIHSDCGAHYRRPGWLS